MNTMTTQSNLMRIEDLRVHFPIYKGSVIKRMTGRVKAVDGLNFSIRRGETFGLVGESGCGKSTTALALLQLNVPATGKVYFEDQDLFSMEKEDLRKLRRRMQIVFQDPYTSLNPRMTVGNIISEPLDVHENLTAQETNARVRELLEIVGLNPDYMKRYPFQFSGGQRQRIGIARAIALKPDFIACDESISALDVSIQAQIINLLESIQKRFGLTYLFIAHDLAVVRHIADRIGVMYLGKLVEIIESDGIFEKAQHPYTKALISAVPIPDPEEEARRSRLILKGDIPNPANPPAGCVFCTRCPEVTEICAKEAPTLRNVGQDGDEHFVACHLYEANQRPS
jgi:oligopeptide transport system ATP-binding protein